LNISSQRSISHRAVRVVKDEEKMHTDDSANQDSRHATESTVGKRRSDVKKKHISLKRNARQEEEKKKGEKRDKNTTLDLPTQITEPSRNPIKCVKERNNHE
jgi:hypothetical protein